MLNKGVSFGLVVPSFWVGLAMVAATALLFREKNNRKPLLLIWIGGVLNFLSRIVWGGVKDNWAIGGVLYNNLADYLILFGMVWYGYIYIQKTRNTRKKSEKR